MSNRDNEGVRPAIYLDMTKAQILSGAGTMDDPFTLHLPGAEAPAKVPAEAPCCVPGECTCCAGCTCGCQAAND